MKISFNFQQTFPLKVILSVASTANLFHPLKTQDFLLRPNLTYLLADSFSIHADSKTGVDKILLKKDCMSRTVTNLYPRR